MRTIGITIALLLAATPVQAGLLFSSPQYYPYSGRELRRHPPTRLPHARYRVSVSLGTELNDTEHMLVRGIQENCLLQAMEHTANPETVLGTQRIRAFIIRTDYTADCMHQMLKKAQRDKRLTNMHIVTEVTR